ncbi:MAG: hypothetical protein AAGI11_06970 [Pseudomonadota bacterium]
MKNVSLGRGFLVLALGLALAGCKIEVRVPPGGSVMSADGSFNCMAGQTCVVNVVDFFFDQTYVAMAAQNHYFAGWEDKEGYLCAGEDGYCTVSTTAFTGNDAVLAFIESDETLVLKPKFVFSPMPHVPELVISPDPGQSD